MCVLSAAGFPLQGDEIAASHFHFSFALWGAQSDAGDGQRVRSAADGSQGSVSPSGLQDCEKGLPARRPRRGWSRPPPPAAELCFSPCSPLPLPAPSLLGPYHILAFPSLCPSHMQKRPPSSGPCTLLPSASPASLGKARLGPARPRRRRVPGLVTPASLWGLSPPRSCSRPPSRLPGSFMPRPVA